MACQVRQGWRCPFQLAIVKVNCLRCERASSINLSTRKMAARGEQLVDKSLQAEKQKDV